MLVLLPVLVLVVMIQDRKESKRRGKGLDTEDLDHQSGTPGVDHETIARQLYDWLKARGSRKAISTHYAMEKAFGRPRVEYLEGGAGYEMVYPDFRLVDYDLYRIDERLMDLIEREGEYEADFSKCEDMCAGQTYDIPFVLKKKVLSNK